MCPGLKDQAGRLQAALGARYTVRSEIGRGGMARVYRAHDRQHDRDVAIKVLHPELAKAVGSERFLREIGIAARLQHPHILPLHDSGTGDGLLYFVMPFVDGETLRDRLRREKQLPIDDALRIAREVADALAHAHDHNIVHRDIKPGNILLSGGHAIVADFGIARAITAAGRPEVTTAGTAVGTPEYMSPEQASAEPSVDGRSDVYSLACVLYEMLGGEPPFTGRTPQVVMARHRQESPLPLKVLRPHLPPTVERALRIALAKVPADRFGTAREFADQLDPARWQEGQTGVWDRATRMRAALVAIALVALVAIVALVARQRRPPKTASSSIGVAVLPFDRAPSAPSDSPLAIGDAVGVFAEAVDWVPGLRAIDGASLISPSIAWRSAPFTELLGAAGGAGARYLAAGTVLTDTAGSRVNIELFTVPEGERVFRASETVAETGWDGPIRRLALRSAEALASRERLDMGSRKAVFAATASPAAVGLMIQGQLRFGQRDFDGAAAAFREAIAADSACGLAYHRLSVAEWWRHDFPAALATVDAGLRRGEQIPRRWRDLMAAQRSFVTSQGERAIAAFQDAVLNQPDEVDGWFGLGEALYHYGGFAGFSPVDARPAFDRLAALDSTFAPVADHQVDLAIYAGDRKAATYYLARLPADDPLRRVREALLVWRFDPPAERKNALARIRPLQRESLSDAVIFAAHGGFDLHLAAAIGELFLGSDRTPDDRRRGVQYRLAVLTALGRWPEALRNWSEVAGRFPYDPWLVEAYFAGFAPDSLAQPMLAWARNQVVERRSPDFGLPLWDDIQQSFQALVHQATRTGDSAQVNDLLQQIEHAQPSLDPTDWTRTALQASLEGRLALLARDTLGAIAHLKESVSRIPELYTANYPQTAMGVQRLLLSELQAARAEPGEAERWRASFSHTWSVADLFYLARLNLIPRGREP